MQLKVSTLFIYYLLKFKLQTVNVGNTAGPHRESDGPRKRPKFDV